MVALSAIVARQSCATVATEQAIHLLLDYVATYPLDSIIYHSSDMILCAHADASFLKETNSRSCAGAHIYLSENDPFPRYNGAVLSIAQITKFVMASTAKAELVALFVTARVMILHRQTLINMGWPQSKSPIQTDNSIAAGVTNKTIVPHRAKMIASGGYGTAAHKTNSAITGMTDPRTWPPTIPNITRIPTTKQTESRIQGSGKHQANSPCANLT